MPVLLSHQELPMTLLSLNVELLFVKKSFAPALQYPEHGHEVY